MSEAWLMKDVAEYREEDIAGEKPFDESVTLENRREPNIYISKEDLLTLGVKTAKYSGDPCDPNILRLQSEEGYNNHDVVEIAMDSCQRSKLKMFFCEHIHDDAEVRYILGGSGYFDVRNAEDDWVRIFCQRGDYIYLPGGIYHRFTLDDKSGAVTAMRLFTTDPKWTPLYRSNEGEWKGRISSARDIYTDMYIKAK